MEELLEKVKDVKSQLLFEYCEHGDGAAATPRMEQHLLQAVNFLSAAHAELKLADIERMQEHYYSSAKKLYG